MAGQAPISGAVPGSRPTKVTFGAYTALVGQDCRPAVRPIPAIRIMPFPSFALYFIAGYVIGVLVHEGGHALFGSLGGIQSRVVLVGGGPLVLRPRIFETWFELRCVPLSGRVEPYPRLAANMWGDVLFCAGGVLANLVVAAALVALLTARVEAVPVASDPLWPALWSQIWIVGTSALPSRTGATDGWLILQILRRRECGPTPMGNAYTAMLTSYPTNSSSGVRFSRTSVRVAYWLSLDHLGWRQAVEALTRELARGRLQPAEEMQVLDALATRILAHDEAAQFPQLDAWSARALALGPDLATLRGTRGAVLVALGRLEEGKALLAPMVDSERCWDALYGKLFLARAEFRLGNIAEATRLLASARAMPEASVPFPSRETPGTHHGGDRGRASGDVRASIVTAVLILRGGLQEHRGPLDLRPVCAYICVEQDSFMPTIETKRSKVVARLVRDGWVARHDGGHDVFKHPERSGRIVLPRHRDLSVGVARAVARQAGWI